MPRTTESTGYADFDQMFNAAQVHTIQVELYDIGHYDLKVIQWKAERAGLCTPDQWLAYRMIGYEYNDNVLFLTFQIKAFNDDASIYSEDEPLHAYLPLNWHPVFMYSC